MQTELLAALEIEALAESVGQQRVESCGELGQIPAQPVVAQQRIHGVLQLLALLGAERLHQRLHLRHPRGELLDDVVERLGTREQLAVARQEARYVRLAAGEAFLEQAVEIADHVAVGRQLVGLSSL